MGTHQEQVVQRYLDDLFGDEEQIRTAVERHWHEDAVWRLIGQTIRSGEWTGIDGIKAFLRLGREGDGRGGPSVQGLSSEYGVHMHIHEIVSTVDDRVIVFCSSDSAGRNGVPYNNEYCWVFTVRGDKIARLDEYCDTLVIEEATFDKKLVPRGTTEPVYKT